MKCIVQNKFWNIAEDYNKEKLLYFLIDRPDLINRFDEFIWKNDKNQWHRNYDLPSFIWNTGSIFWSKNDKKHRKDNKPAGIWNDGTKEYWINNNFIKREE